MNEFKIHKCKNCGGELDYGQAVNGVIKCNWCQSIFTVPKSNSKATSYLDMGAYGLDTCNFDDAYTAYQKASEIDKNEPEAYFGMALATAQVQYLKDYVNNRMQPIVHAVTEKSFLQDKNFKKALECATPEQKTEYTVKAKKIDDIRRQFYELKKSGLKYDCFICVKVTEEGGRHTEDSHIASTLYHKLQDAGYSPFYSEEEIKGRTGADYEALILYALHNSPSMLLACTDESYLQTPWVKNEYTRYLNMLNQEEKHRDSLTIVFKDNVIEKLPGINGKIQGVPFNTYDALPRIIDFVKIHTPLARAKKEEAERQKQKENEELKKSLAEQKKRQEELEKKLANMYSTGGLSDEELLARLEKMNQYKELKFKAEAESLSLFDIKGNVLYRCKEIKLKEAEIPYGVTSIDDDAFRDCTNLKSVTIPDSVTSIGTGAFYNCQGLTSITIPDSVTSIGDFAFNSCYNLTNVTISNRITSIGKQAFCSCIRLTSVIIPDSVISIGKEAFCSCTKLTSVTIPNSVTSLGESAFSGCESLTSVTIPNSVTSLGKGAFFGCKSLISISISSSVTSINELAFAACESLTKIIIPESVTSIGGSVFSGCGSLKSVTIPKSVTSIGARAFYGCGSLKSVTISKSVTSIGDYAFYGCSNEILILCEAESKPVGWDRYWGPSGKNAVVWGALICGTLTEKEIELRFKILRIFDIDRNGVLVRFKDGKMKEVVIPDIVTSIGTRAFCGCGNLTSVTIPNSVTSIGESAFHSCSSLTNVTIPNSVTSIGESAFHSCSNLTSVTIPNSVTSIGESAFHSCSNLTSVTIPNSVEHIGAYVFTENDKKIIIKCERRSKPKDWDKNWNGQGLFKRAKVIWSA